MAAKALGVSSFTAVGHLLHINLREHLIAHKHQIGEALLAKNPRALAVVNKLNNIDNAYRNFEIEIIARREGCDKSDEELMWVEVNENKCRFQMDFSKVYWNSRLGTEHERILNKLNKATDIVFDLFAGVGPFSVPAAKARCKVYANDLNPESIKWLEVNMKRNKVKQEFYEIHNMDAKDFILNEMRTKLIDEYRTYIDEELATKPVIHIIMNLPALAPTFLPHFIGLFKDPSQQEKLEINSKPLLTVFNEIALDHIIHCYCFLKGSFDDPKDEVRTIVEEHLGRELTDNQLLDIFRVRNVAPFKDMYRVDLKLDASILFDIKTRSGIMKNNTNKLVNGQQNIKRVTINGKRTRNDSSDSLSDDQGSKRTKYSDYCVVM